MEGISGPDKEYYIIYKDFGGNLQGFATKHFIWQLLLYKYY